MRRAWPLLGAVVAVAVVAGCSGRSSPSPTPPSPSSAAAPTPTALHVVRTAAVLPVTRTLTGSCFTTSVADLGRSDAYRCLAGNLLLDPCLPEQPGTAAGVSLVCPSSPSGPSLRIRTVAALPAGLPAPPGPSAWVVRTRDGLTCTSIGGGTAQPLAGGVATYRCGPAGRQGSLVGLLEQGSGAAAQVLTARFAPPGATAPAQVRTVRLTDAWS